MDRWRGKVAVVTGASAGIGLAIARVLVREGMLVVGLARRKDVMLDEMKDASGPGEFHARECDVAVEASVKEAFDFIERTFREVHVLVNNAGIVILKSIEEMDVEEMDNVIKVNLQGALYCYKHAVGLMKSHEGEANIININSITGHKVPSPGWMRDKYVPTNVYPVTKFALTALSETLTYELRGTKIRVTNLSPGYVRTTIAELSRSSSMPALRPVDVAESVVFAIGVPSNVLISQLTIKPMGELW